MISSSVSALNPINKLYIPPKLAETKKMEMKMKIDRNIVSFSGLGIVDCWCVFLSYLIIIMHAYVHCSLNMYKWQAKTNMPMTVCWSLILCSVDDTLDVPIWCEQPNGYHLCRHWNPKNENMVWGPSIRTHPPVPHNIREWINREIMIVHWHRVRANIVECIIATGLAFTFLC